MFEIYWRTVFRPHLWVIVLIALATTVGSVAEVASIGMIVPLAGTLIGSEQAMTNPINAALMRLAGTLGFSPSSESVVLAGMLVLTGLVILKNVLKLAKTRWVSWLQTNVANNTRERMLAAYLRAPIADILGRGRGAILEDIEKGSVGLRSAILSGSELLSSIIYAVSTFVLLLYLSWGATLLIGVLLLFCMRYMRILMEDRAKLIGRRLHAMDRQRSAMVIDVLDGSRVVKTNNLEANAVTRLKFIQDKRLPLFVRSRLFMEIPAAFFEVTGYIFALLLMGLMFGVPNLGLSLPKLMAMVVGLRRLLPSAGGVNTNLVQLSSLLRQIEVADDALNNLKTEHSGVLPLPEGGVKTIQLENISFCYPERANSKALEGVFLTFGRGQVTAVVGHTGAGKSTLTDLLVRLYDPSSGRIMVNGIDLLKFDLGSWRRCVGYVGQDTFLFNATLRENIVLWDETVSSEDLESAVVSAQLHDFVHSLPDGYKTMVGDRGLKLSGGQRQRVAIARATLFRPEVMIFDEATSALDNVTERAVHAAIVRMRVDAIVILVAHRLSTVQDADQIVVLDNGRVVEQGGHDELLQAQGHFWDLYQGSEENAALVSG